MTYEFELTRDAKELLYGHLLGDGCLSWKRNGKTEKYYIAFSISSKHEDYIKYIIRNFEQCNIPYANGTPRKLTHGKYTWYNWGTRSFTSDFMKQMRFEWYEQENTKLPPDIFITKNILRTFYIDDGYINYSKGRLRGISMSLENMYECDAILMAKLISKAIKDTNNKVKIYKKGNGYTIRINEKQTLKKFFDYIGPCPEELYDIFRYKWPINDHHYYDWRKEPVGDNRKVVMD